MRSIDDSSFNGILWRLTNPETALKYCSTFPQANGTRMDTVNFHRRSVGENASAAAALVPLPLQMASMKKGTVATPMILVPAEKKTASATLPFASVVISTPSSDMRDAEGG